MDRAAFEAALKQDGFELSDGKMAAGTVVDEHTHPFDARLYMLSGSITIGRDGEKQTYAAGDSCSVDANTTHTEEVGDEDAIYLVGRREV